jgi:superfamily I DNA/RNA helicase
VFRWGSTMTMSKSRALSTLLVPRPREERSNHSLVDVKLDFGQRAAIARPMDQAVLVLGEAGHGKTTVALRRLEFVWSALKKRPGRPPRAAVVVPTEGLSRLLQPLLRRLGIDVEARTYDAWARRQARRAFSELPRRETELTPPAVQRVKRSPALRSAIALLAARAPGRIDDDADACVSPSTGLISRGDLQHLFGDRRLLEMVAGESQDIPLKSHVPARLVYDGSFRTHHSIEVTLVAEVKGLEFDYVVIPDASDVAYPDSPAARRAMYVAVTRARFQVLIAHSGKRSPIVPMLR